MIIEKKMQLACAFYLMVIVTVRVKFPPHWLVPRQKWLQWQPFPLVKLGSLGIQRVPMTVAFPESVEIFPILEDSILLPVPQGHA